MNLSLEILDHIFSFLISDHETLIACSNDAVLAPIVERHLYYRVVVYIGLSDCNYAFEPDYISKLVSENPHILHYVRTLAINIQHDHYGRVQDSMDKFATTLVKFPLLERIMTTNLYWPPAFRAAVEDRLKLPTVKEIYLRVSIDFPLSLFDSCKNIKNLSLSGFGMKCNGRFCDSNLPQLKSLTLFDHPTLCPLLLAWLKLHIQELQSLKVISGSSVEMLPELLEACSGTLKKLDIDLTSSRYYAGYLRQGEINMECLPEMSSIPLNLQQLTIRAGVDLNDDPATYMSYLPAAGEIISLFRSSLRHVILDIPVSPAVSFASFAEIDFSPLTILVHAPSIARIDLYIQTRVFPPAVTRAQLISSLQDYSDMMRMIEEGVLVIHPEASEPNFVIEPRYDYAKAWPVSAKA